MDKALAARDLDGLTRMNQDFHRDLYGLNPDQAAQPLIESVWLRFGPFMRLVYGRFGTAILIDQHERAIEAIAARDEAGLRAAIRADLLDGMNEIGAASLVD